MHTRGNNPALRHLRVRPHELLILMAATRPLVLFNSDEEGLELEVTRARREAHIHRREDLHARSGQAFRLSQEREEK